MKKICFVLALILLLGFAEAQAHSLYFTLYDAEDGTIELEGMYSTGEVATKTPVRIYKQGTDTVLWTGETDEDGMCLFPRPKEPYEVELDAGPGHTTREDGI